MAKKKSTKNKPKRLMARVRRQVGKPTMKEIPKTVYDRNDFKKETEEIISDVCTCIGMNCICVKEKEE